MTDFSTMVVESIRCFGVQPSDKWNQYNWNAFLWGEGTNQVLASETVLIAETENLSDAITQIGIAKVIAETLASTGSPTSEVLRDGAGYLYVFPNNATNGEDRDPVTWTSSTVSTASYTCQAAASTTWS